MLQHKLSTLLAGQMPEHGALTAFFLVSAALTVGGFALLLYAWERVPRGDYRRALLASLSLLTATLLAWAFFSLLPAGSLQRSTAEGVVVTPIYAENPYILVLAVPLIISAATLLAAAAALILYGVRLAHRAGVLAD